VTSWANGRKSNVALDEGYNGWHPDPFGRFDERYIVYGEPSRLVRNDGIEQTDRQLLSLETPAVAAVEHHDGPYAYGVNGPDPVPVASSRFHVRRSRQRAIAVVVIVLACALIASVLVSRQHAHPATPTSPSGQRPRKQVNAKTSVPYRRTPRSPRRRSVLSPATPSHRPAAPMAPKPEHARTTIMAWANELLSDMNNVNEVAYDYGDGTLERTACQRTWNAAADLPAATLSPDVSAAAKAASHDIMTFASECAHIPGCPIGRASCGPTKFAGAYRRSVGDLDVLRADLSND